MKTNLRIGLLLAGVMLGSTGFLPGQTPFSDRAVKTSPTITTSGKEGGKPGFWSRIAQKARQTYGNLTTRLNQAVSDNAPPAFISKAAVIPGCDSRAFVCQGISYLPDQVIDPASDQIIPRPYRNALLSYYPEPGQTDAPSQLVVVEISSGKPLRRFGLYRDDGVPYTGHAGGVAVAGAYVWVASGFKIYGFRLQQILDFVNNTNARAASNLPGIPSSLEIPATDLVADRIFEVDSKASFISFDGTHLWVGDFVKSSNDEYAPVKHHTTNPFHLKTWIAGYKVNSEGLPTASLKYTFQDGDSTHTAFKPDRLIFCRESVQGMAMCGTHAALSISYGALNSKLAFYHSPFNRPATRISFTPAGQKKAFTAEGWVLSEGVNWQKTVELAAGAEDLEFDGRYLYVTFEGSSPNYRGKWISINPLVSISERFYLIKPSKIVE